MDGPSRAVMLAFPTLVDEKRGGRGTQSGQYKSKAFFFCFVSWMQFDYVEQASSGLLSGCDKVGGV